MQSLRRTRAKISELEIAKGKWKTALNFANADIAWAIAGAEHGNKNQHYSITWHPPCNIIRQLSFCGRELVGLGHRCLVSAVKRVKINRQWRPWMKVTALGLEARKRWEFVVPVAVGAAGNVENSTARSVVTSRDEFAEMISIFGTVTHKYLSKLIKPYVVFLRVKTKFTAQICCERHRDTPKIIIGTSRLT